MRTILLDYGAGNLRSVATALEALGVRAAIGSSAQVMRGADTIVFPGVGHAGTAMHDLHGKGIVSELREFVRRGGVLLGICVGAQVLFGRNEEGDSFGVGILEGDVRRLPSVDAETGERVKVPQIGWNPVRYRVGNPLFAGVPQDSAFYFVHSYYLNPRERETAIGWSQYGVRFAAAVAKGGVFGVQFHPEKSGRVGLRVLENFFRYAQWRHYRRRVEGIGAAGAEDVGESGVTSEDSGCACGGSCGGNCGGSGSCGCGGGGAPGGGGACGCGGSCGCGAHCGCGGAA